MWTVPPLWHGETVAIIGGGPSLRGVDLGRLPAGWRILATNNAHAILPRWDLHFFADDRWYRWNADRLGAPGLRVTVADDLPAEAGILVLGRTGDTTFRRSRAAALSTDPQTLAGECSGGMSINLAALAGAARIILLGFDMRPVGNWHAEHQAPTPHGQYRELFIPAISRMAAPLAGLGVEVINATPDSALTCFPPAALETLI